jgi:cytochrome c-type biogenesis protein CcmE
MCSLYAIAVWTDRRRFLAGVAVLAIGNGLAYLASGPDADIKAAGIFTWLPTLAMVLVGGAKRSDLGTSRFRIQGNVIPSSVDDEGQRMEFDLKYRDAVVHVVHTGDVPSLFKPAIPVVLEGAFQGDTYHSDRMLLKHDETYDEEHKSRTREAEQDARS